MGEAEFGQWLGRPGRGIIARLESWDERVDRYGARFWACDFIAPEGGGDGRMWPDDASTSTPERLQAGGWYFVIPASGQWGTQSLNRLTAIIPIAEAFACLDSSPGDPSADDPNWKRARRWFERIPFPVIQAFVMLVFMDESLRQGFFRVPASRQHHHSWEGGLAEHALEVAEHVEGHPLIRDPLQRCLGSVAGLLHDVGKVRTLSLNPSTRRHSEILGHDRLTLEVLAGPLAWLDRVDPDVAHMLRYLLVWDPNQEPRPLIPTAIAVREADRVSSAASAYEITFANAPGWARFATLNSSGPRNRFWRPVPLSRKNALIA